ncbi:MAG: hypothetical protein GQ525_01205, partial [Draconibacterium sp.]|nr:hypothetical protein [Draconibacterium sp.]
MKLLIFVALVLIVVACGTKSNPEITIEDLRANMEYLASDSLKGRKPGKPGGLLAAQFIRNKFENAGLELMFDNGFQKFGLLTSAELGEGNTLNINNKSFEAEKDFLPYAFSANTEVEAQVVFAGFGLQVDIDTIKWDDFEEVDVAGKWILALQGDPDLENAQSPFVEFSSERAKALIASDNNAAGLILVAGTKFNEKDELSSLFFDKNSRRYSFPIMQVTREVANEILANSGETVESLEAKILENNKPISLQVETKVAVNINLV